MVAGTSKGVRTGLPVESNGINVIADAERRGRPRRLFWPWFGANVSILGLSYGAFALGFGISFWQALIAGVVGITFSFLLCGFVALAGKRGSAPTMRIGTSPPPVALMSRSRRSWTAGRFPVWRATGTWR